MPQYLIRLDDLCPTNNLSKWERFYNLFDRYGIKPIIAVIPDNKDPKLAACGSFNHNYWQLVRDLQRKGYIIAMHGFEHRYVNRHSGLFKRNNRSEFAGLPQHLQDQKIKAAFEIFKKQNISTDIFIAPAHTFDRNTLTALQKHSEIRTISDGLLRSPYLRHGFKWIPVQLSEAEFKKSNTWTFNYHPETCTNEGFQKLEAFIDRHHKYFISLSELIYRHYTVCDYLYEQYCIYTDLGRDFLKGQMSRFRLSKI